MPTSPLRRSPEFLVGCLPRTTLQFYRRGVRSSDWRRLVGALLALVALGGCGGAPAGGINAARTLADDAVRFLRGQGDVRLPSVTIPAPRVTTLLSTVDQEAAALVGPHVDGLTVDEADRVVSAACLAQDLITLGQAATWDEAATEAVKAVGAEVSQQLAVRGLAEDLEEASSPADVTSTLASFAICQAASP